MLSLKVGATDKIFKDRDAVPLMKDYMESGSFSRAGAGGEITGAASIILNGNINQPVETVLQTSHLFSPLSELDMIISVGYRIKIKSHVAIRFRIWATERLKEYIVKGFTLDDDRLKNPDYIFSLFQSIISLNMSHVFKILFHSFDLENKCYKKTGKCHCSKNKNHHTQSQRFFEKRNQNYSQNCT